MVQLVERRRWFLTPTYIKGVLNVWADRLSRFTATPTEWGLDDDSFQWILAQPGVPVPEVDLFAMPWNNKLEVFVSPVETQGSWGTDAMTIQWDHWQTVYLFPLLPMISKVLSKLTLFHGTAILIAPWWPSRVWFPLLRQRCPHPLRLPNPILTQVVRGESFFSAAFLTRRLHAWIL